VAGRSGVGPVTGVPVEDLPVRIAAQVHGFDAAGLLGVRAARQLDRFAQFALVAAREAVRDAGFALPRGAAGDRETTGGPRWATVIGSGLGGLATYETGVQALEDRNAGRVSPYLAPGVIANAAVAAVAQDLDAQGPSLCPVTACASGTDAVGQAADLIRLGRADVVVAGASDAPVVRPMLAGFGAMRAASTRNDDPQGACRPFARDRGGLVVGEGAAVLVLEERQAALSRGATPLAEVAGYAATSDAYHITSPREDGAAATAALRGALADAGLAACDVDHVNAHGTGTRLNDVIEACVIREVLGAGVAVTATKSLTGHLMGAAGALEALVCVQALREGLLPPTRNAEDLDPACDLDVVRAAARRVDATTAVSNSFGFGGHNACLVLRRA